MTTSVSEDSIAEHFSSAEEIIEDVRNGKMIILVDAETGERLWPLS